jgi:AcrR family transcriptional regulator
MQPQARKELILDEAIQLSIRIGYNSITRDLVAERMGIASGLVGKYYPRMHNLRVAIMEAAINREILEILAQGLTVNDPLALTIPACLKDKVHQYLINK